MKFMNFRNYVLFIAPALLIYLLFFAGPIFSGLYYGFTDWNGFSFKADWVGLENFREAFRDPLLLTALKNMAILSAVVIVLQHTASILLAVLLDQKLKGIVWMRAIIFFPVILNTVVIGYVWSYMYAPMVGFLPKFFAAVGLDGLAGLDWLGDPKLAIYAIALVMVWQYTGYSMMIYLAGLQSVSGEIYEASSIDGAGPWNKFWRVTLPLLIPSIIVNTVLSVIGCMKMFEHVFIMTQGGPANSTQTFGIMIYQYAFKTSQMGYGTAMAMILSVMILAVTFVQIKLLSRLEVAN
ncbi:carbohydrate ABC transporter permease [Paenibacillus sp. HW567]|uniref:carbohydrate ABC transporter permease n=1 Tax=Paenibacillus sp. HW567 TaxID=1034769 RepID=UPI000376997D|nr:sugar ABC transporter permease [Paenibacillus sp. HW567]